MATIAVRTGIDQRNLATDAYLDQAPRSPFHESDHRLACDRRPGLYWQITRGHVSFAHIAKAWWIRNDPAERAGKEDERVSQLLEHLAREKFANDHGGIHQVFWHKKPWAGCALTGDGWVHSFMNSDDAELNFYANKVHQLCRDAHRTFDLAARPGNATEGGNHTVAQIFHRHSSPGKAKPDLNESAEMLYSVLTRVISAASVLEDEHATQQQKDGALAAVKTEWEVVRSSVEGMIQRQARFEYFEGVGLGALVTIPVLAVGGWLAARYGGSYLGKPGAFAAAIIGGAAGAVISVTQRLTAGNLQLDFTAPKYQKIALGALRPIVGAVFVAVVYFAIVGGMLGIEERTGTNASSAVAFFAVAGFAAGFSERFATDVLERASSSIVPAARHQQNTDNSDELARLLSEQPCHVQRPAVTEPHRTADPRRGWLGRRPRLRT